MYSGLKDDYKDNLTLSSYLNNAKELLAAHFHQFYANQAQSSKQSQSSDSPTGSTSNSRSKFDFTARYSLYLLATDVLSIPGKIYIFFVLSDHWALAHWVIFLGSAVAVERIFSGGRDTVSLRRPSLHSDTIRILMISKHCHHMARNLFLAKKV